MTLLECYQTGRRRLLAAGVENAAFDAGCLFEKTFGLTKAQMYLQGGQAAPEASACRFLRDIDSRASGEPLQYLLGEWEFRNRLFDVGKGVLIPREETELLVEFAAEKLCAGGKLLDLCAGSGAIAVCCAAEHPDAAVTAVELSADALRFLRRNVERNQVAVQVLEDNVLSPRQLDLLPEQNMILSNPPYVLTSDLPGLQREVQHEPVMALDGGADGLLFYRAIADQWLPKLKKGGWLAVECGQGEAAAVCDIFERAGLREREIRRDFNGIDRVVAGKK